MKMSILILGTLVALSSPAQKPRDRAISPVRVPKGYSIPRITHSPDGRYGVLVPDLERYDWYAEQNKVIDLRTGRAIATIHAHSGAVKANHVEIEKPNWSRDGSLLLWRVAGKWSPTALVLIKIKRSRVLLQVNILDTVQKAILARTKKASPRKYRAAVRRNRGNAAAYPEGFTVDVSVSVEPGAPLTLPLNVGAYLTSNPKGIESYPKSAELNSELKGVITKNGRFRVKVFRLLPASRN
jgi:hypothetical protein